MGALGSFILEQWHRVAPSHAYASTRCMRFSVSLSALTSHSLHCHHTVPRPHSFGARASDRPQHDSVDGTPQQLSRRGPTSFPSATAVPAALHAGGMKNKKGKKRKEVHVVTALSTLCRHPKAIETCRPHPVHPLN